MFDCLYLFHFFGIFISTKQLFQYSFVIKFFIYFQLMVPNWSRFQQVPPEQGQVEIQPEIISQKQISPHAQYTVLKGHKKIVRKIEVYSRIGDKQQYHRCQATKIISKFAIKKQHKHSHHHDEHKNRKNTSRKRKNSSDSEYNVKNQKKDRNVTSNLIHHLIKYLIVSKGPEQFVRKLLKSSNFTLTYQQFLQRLDQLQVKLKTYITLNQIQSLWFSQDPNEQEFCLIIRILSKKFLSTNGFLSVYYSNKFNKASKIVHCKGVRNLIFILMKKDLQQLQYALQQQA